jgi:hypothetical protein
VLPNRIYFLFRIIPRSYEAEFNWQDKSSGIYLCRIKADELQQVMKMALFRQIKLNNEESRAVSQLEDSTCGGAVL